VLTRRVLRKTSASWAQEGARDSYFVPDCFLIPSFFSAMVCASPVISHSRLAEDDVVA
jgi:hypothetical protein